MFEKGLYIWDFVFIPLLSPFFWWLGFQYDKAKFLAEKDFLTEVYNRRFVYEFFPKLLAKVDKNKEKLSVFVLDIDDFKEINDTRGHEVGDSVIQSISNIILKNTRKGDLLARWGGDEFLLITIYTDNMCPSLLIERIETHLRNVSTNLGANISVSIGHSTYPSESNPRNLDGLIKRADHNMYEMKALKKYHKNMKD